MTATPASPAGTLLPPRDVLLAGLRLSPTGTAVAVEQDGGPVLTWANPAFEQLLGYPAGQVVGILLADVAVRPLDPGACGPEEPADLAAVVTAAHGSADVSLQRTDGTTLLARVSGARVDDPDLPYWVVRCERIDEQVRADARLRASEERFRTLAAQAPIGIVVSEVGLRLGFVNERARQLWDQPLEVMQSPRWMDSVDPEDREHLVAALAGVLAGDDADVAVRIRTASGSRRSLRLRAAPVRLEGQGAGFIASIEDTTAQTRHEADLRHAALHDPLTGLPNRAHLDEVLEEIGSGRRAGDSATALLFFDLDDFKRVNDRLGHHVGDAVLVEVGQRLAGALRDDDLLVRLGGDEFVVLCRGIPGLDVAMAVAERMRRQLDAPFAAADRRVQVRASVGVAMLGPDDDRSQELLRNADAAMYEAKRTGRGRVVLFREEAHRAATRRRELLEDLRAALEQRQLSVWWQPIVRLTDGGLAGVEALVRWAHPTRGLIPVPDLIALAEEHELLAALDQQVLEAACGQFARWRADHGHRGPDQLFVNLAAQHLGERLVDVVAGVLTRTGVPPACLAVEVDETAMAVPATRQGLVALRAIGTTVVVDRFDDGAASLRTLLDPCVDIVKANPFAGQERDPGDRLLSTVAGLLHPRGGQVVAHGIETPARLQAAEAAGCTLGQGFLLGRPMPADELAATSLGVRRVG